MDQREPLAAQADARPDYGLDAPPVIRNLLAVGGLGLALALTAALGIWSGMLVLSLGADLVFPIASMGLWGGLGCVLMACWMIWDSKVGKLRGRERLLDEIRWSGGERVLDVGCGRGLMLVGAAKRLRTGTATGIDLWSARDLSGNEPAATLANARREGVSERVDVQTGDMRQLPFADATFDVVVSRAAIHNLAKSADRAQAIGEIARVLKPGGVALIDDIRHGFEYQAAFELRGCRRERRIGSALPSALLALCTLGALRPVTLLVRKPA
jgi:SAM-dependent methyltransferase